MKFWEAMKALQEGQKVRHNLMEPRAYLQILENGELLRYRTESYSPLMAYISAEWELYEEPVHMLSFQAVIKGLREGKSFARKGWSSDLALFVMGHEIYPRSKFGIQTLHMEDFEANDWEEVEKR